MTNLSATNIARQTAVAFLVCLACLSPRVALAQGPAPAEPPKTWTGAAGVGLSITSGNSDTMNYNLSFDLTRTPKARNVMKWTGLYLRCLLYTSPSPRD